MYSLGNNKFGQLGLKIEHTSKPLKISGIQRITEMACGAEHSLLLTENNQVYVFGLNCSGQLGTQNFSSVLIPQLIQTPLVTQIAANGNSSYLLI